MQPYRSGLADERSVASRHAISSRCFGGASSRRLLQLTISEVSRILRDIATQHKSVLNMTIKHNITVAIEPNLLKKARAVAARRGTSVSALVASELGELVNSDRDYEAARKRAKAILQSGLSFQGARMNDRTVAHERRRIR